MNESQRNEPVQESLKVSRDKRRKRVKTATLIYDFFFSSYLSVQLQTVAEMRKVGNKPPDVQNVSVFTAEETNVRVFLSGSGAARTRSQRAQQHLY